MEAMLVEKIPTGAWQYEPKWDGFRCLAFRDGKKVELQSKSGQPLARYFPEIVENLRKVSAPRFVLDGELVIPDGKRLSFDALLQRIHPAESRVRALSRETPAAFVVFDLVVSPDGKSIAEKPLKERRRRLETFVRDFVESRSGVLLSPATTDLRQAKKWLSMAGGAFDPAWSSDGSKIVFVSATGTPYLRQVTLASGESLDFAQDTAALGQPVCNAQACLAVSGAYGGTGNIVSMSTTGGTLTPVSAVSGSEASPAFVQP
ncbi:MAG: hypothetical protein ACREFI_16615 [Stellaceae bacterium]